MRRNGAGPLQLTYAGIFGTVVDVTLTAIFMWYAAFYAIKRYIMKIGQWVPEPQGRKGRRVIR